MKHRVDFRVYYEDTDAGGIMYHASFIRFCERGRGEFLRHLGLTFASLANEDRIQFVIRHLDAHYLKPARLDDLLTVETGIKTLKNSSFVAEQSIFCQDSVLFTMLATVVCVDMSGKPVRVPDPMRKTFEQYQEKAA